MLTASQLPLNLVLLKNIEVSGIHWGEYTSMYSPLFESCGVERLFSIQLGSQGTFLPYSKRLSGASSRSLLRPSSSHSSSSMLQSRKVTPVVYPEIYSLERLSDGLVALEDRRTWGKAVVRVRDEPAPPAKL